MYLFGKERFDIGVLSHESCDLRPEVFLFSGELSARNKNKAFGHVEILASPVSVSERTKIENETELLYDGGHEGRLDHYAGRRDIRCADHAYRRLASGRIPKTRSKIGGPVARRTIAWQETIRLRPDDAQAWYGLGLLYSKQGNRSEVAQVYEKLKTLDQNVADRFLHSAVLPAGKDEK